MKLKELSPILALLLGIGVIFGTFERLASGDPLGFDWFVNMLWFVVGFPVLIIIGMLIFATGMKGEDKISED